MNSGLVPASRLTTKSTQRLTEQGRPGIPAKFPALLKDMFLGCFLLYIRGDSTFSVIPELSPYRVYLAVKSFRSVQSKWIEWSGGKEIKLMANESQHDKPNQLKLNLHLRVWGLIWKVCAKTFHVVARIFLQNSIANPLRLLGRFSDTRKSLVYRAVSRPFLSTQLCLVTPRSGNAVYWRLSSLWMQV